MDSLQTDLAQFNDRSSLEQMIQETEQAIRLVTDTQNMILADNGDRRAKLAKLHPQTKKCLDVINSSLKDAHRASQAYGKVLERRFKTKPVTGHDEAELATETLLDRAISMHLLREGHFRVATTFLGECLEISAEASRINSLDSTPVILRSKFVEMYHILHEMRSNRNLQPAMNWATTFSKALQTRGSNLEFELARLQFIWLFSNESSPSLTSTERQKAAILYARGAFGNFGARYLRDIQQLVGAMAFSSDVPRSPYGRLFQCSGEWEEVALSFTREYCSLLGLSADSPLFIATTAGAMALPMLEKLRMIMKEKRTEWTTEHELPVEIPLPVSYRFHSIFVCPVSKEQTTDRNPPMLLPCGHVIAEESLKRLSKLAKFKCPYCPEESHHSDARKVFL